MQVVLHDAMEHVENNIKKYGAVGFAYVNLFQVKPYLQNHKHKRVPSNQM
jgi:hypothetical protein